MRISSSDVPALERGVSLLGSGGGGDTRTAATLLRRRLATAGDLTVTPVEDLPDDACVTPVGIIGATAAFVEKLPGGGEFRAALAAIERWTGERVDALMSIEVGGLNGLLPAVVAADFHLGYADADLSGRGVPRLDQFSVAAAGRGIAPVAVAEPSGQVLVLAEGTPADVERTARAFLTSAGGWAALAAAPIRARDLPDCSVLGSTSGALALGRRTLDVRERPDGPELADATGGRVLALGRAVEVSRRHGAARHGRAGFGRGSVTVEDHTTRSLLRLEMENEYLMALRDGAVVASTPDVLAVLDRRTCVPIRCEDLRHGAEVAVLQLAAAPFWTDPRHMPAVEPRVYGIECDPVVLR